MKALRTAAEALVGRVCAYAALAILSIATLFASDITLFLRVASGRTTVLAILLLVRARQVLHCDVRKTAIWNMLAPMERSLAERARETVAAVLHDAYLGAARFAAGAAAGLWALALVASYAQQPAG
jgi:hypothetical protein